MKTKRIGGYMAFSVLCACVCCSLAAYLLLENAVNFSTAFDTILLPAVYLLAAIVLLRQFIVLYRLKLETKRLWAKIAGTVLFPALLLAVLYAYAALFRYTQVNHMFWSDPIPYTSFLKQAAGSQIRWQEWILPSAVLLAVEGIYLFTYETLFGRRVILPVWAMLYTSPFRSDEADILRLREWDSEDTFDRPKKTVVLKFGRNDPVETGGNEDGE